MKTIEFDFTALGLSPWSFSKLKSLQQCPLQFYLKYLVKLKVVRKREGVPITEIGSAAHRILENIVLGKTITDSFKIAKDSYIDSIGHEYWTEHVASLEFNIAAFRSKLDSFEQATPIKRFIPELKIGIDRNWERTGFFDDNVYFRGITDLILQLENNDAIIIDHKNGGGTQYGGIKNHQAQLDTYKVLAHFGVEKVTGAQSGIHFIKEGAIILGDYSPAVEIETRLRDRLQFFIQSAIDTTVELGYFKHKRGSWCTYCEYDPKCKEGGYLEEEKETKQYFVQKA